MAQPNVRIPDAGHNPTIASLGGDVERHRVTLVSPVAEVDLAGRRPIRELNGRISWPI
jgi:hypothetical protein